MNTSLAPTHIRLFGECCILWYEVSNTYSIVDYSFKTVLDLYLRSDTMRDFTSQLGSIDATSNPKTTANTLLKYLESCNTQRTDISSTSIDSNISNRSIVKYYSIKGKVIKIYYDSELVAKTIHPALAHLSTKITTNSSITFDVFIKDKQLCLFKNKELICCVPQQEYHRIQGKFIMHLLCFIHNKTEADWIGTFHGSTITDGKSSILVIGESGKGKSTLCALLTANGFDLLADDVSPMLSGSKHIYYNPAAISVKEGAFHLLSTLIKGFKNLPIVQFKKGKGQLKYMPCSVPKENSVPCKAIILVNYKANAQTKLKTVSIKTLLETLIPESWLSHNPIHAKEFLDWLETVHMYELTYSNTQSVSHELSLLFHQLNKK